MGQLVKDRRFLLGGVFLFLLDFSKMPVNGFNELCGGIVDCFKRAFQLRKLTPAAPPGDIPKGIIRRIKSVMLAEMV